MKREREIIKLSDHGTANFTLIRKVETKISELIILQHDENN